MKFGKLCHIIIFLMILFPFTPASAQINRSLLENTRNLNISMKVKDKSNSEPIDFATAYLIPKGDTTIIDFCLSDKEGLIIFKEIPVGEYELNIDMMGYTPYKKLHKFNDYRRVDLGDIFLEVNHEFIQSAKISATGNPIRIVNDTVEFTASAFRVGQNAMLEDLLKKMPGMEVENGKVKLNGQEINRITVGGKTFFFNDQKAALKNLPAHIIEKIKVMDKDKEDAAFTGVSTRDDKEKVMDVGLKKEFQKGWFGNIAAAGGTNINSDKDNELMEKSGFVYNANGMLSGYNEKDQVVFLANAQNISDGNSLAYSFSGGMLGAQNIENAFGNMMGLSTSASSGVNWNTQRLKGMDIASSVKYDYDHKNGKRQSYRTSFQQEGPDLNANSTYTGTGHENGISLNLEFKNTEKKKYHFEFRPYVGFKKNFTHELSTSETRPADSAETIMNQNTSLSSGHSSIFNNGMDVRFGITHLGKQNRSLLFKFNYSYGDGNGKSTEDSKFMDTKRNKLLSYISDQHTLNLSGGITYTEPFTDNWLFNIALRSSYSSSNKTKDAFNADGGKNEYYSSLSQNLFYQETGSFTLQYRNKANKIQAGANVMTSQNRILSQSLGQETESGKGMWDWKVSPSINYYFHQEGHRIAIYYNGWTAPVSAEQVVPNLDLKDPLQIRTGNVYLKPYFSNQLYANYGFNNKKTFTYLSLDLNMNVTLNGISNAIWFDENGLRYAVPVNVRKPQTNFNTNINFNQPFGPQRNFTFSTYLGLSYRNSDSYQAKGVLNGLDLNQFDYNSFMSTFWGNEDGNRFYNGESGFSESSTLHLHSWGNVQLKYTGDIIDISLRQSFGNNTSHYSLDPKANRQTWDFRTTASLNLRPGKEWEILTDAGYAFYKGYPTGYGEPQFLWNLSLNKNINSFTISLKAIDILNQTKNFSHNVSNEYVEDTYVNAFGRYITLGLTWNFGKKNAAQNKNVRNAMFRMQ